jgi:acetyl-CoA C-acetyltransferase
VLVGAAALTQRTADPANAADAVSLMTEALRAAADDAGGRDPHRLISQADLILAPQGSWRCSDPGRVVGAQLGISPHTVLAVLGVLQQALFTHACRAIAKGQAEVALICGGEARARAATAARNGVQIAAEPDPEQTPDTVLSPEQEVLSRLEIERKLYVPARQYAIMETALRAASGQTIAGHAREVAALWDGFSAVARARPEAWKRDAPPLGAGMATAENPWYAWPYTKQHCSYWTVDQAAGHILCSASAAQAAGIPRERWVFPLAAAESNAMIMLSERAEPHRSPAVAAAGRALTELAGTAPADADHIDLYSCFPAAVRVQAAELGLSADRPWTVTGGMSFGGGPLNNYVLQSVARMMQVLREDPGSTGLVTSISGMITKQGMGLWSTTPPVTGFRSVDVTEQARADTKTAEAVGDYRGKAEVLGYTVAYERGAPSRGVVIAAVTGGSQTVARSDDPAQLADMIATEWVGRSVEINESTFAG